MPEYGNMSLREELEARFAEADKRRTEEEFLSRGWRPPADIKTQNGIDKISNLSKFPILSQAIKNEGDLITSDFANLARRGSYITGGFDIWNIGKDFFKYRYDNRLNKLSDKYRHAYINCNAAQRGIKDAINVGILSRLREYYDVKSKQNTQQDSDKDMDANLTGRFLGIKYPDGDCDELVQRYYKKTY